MKKVLITIGLAAMVASASAQGLVNFLNSSTTLITLTDGRQAVPNLGPLPAGVAGTYRFELFRAPAGTSTDVGFVSTGLIATNIATAGRIIGGNGLAIPGTALGGTAALLVRGWSSNLGATYAEAFANWNAGVGGFLGSSSIAATFLLGGDGGAGNIPTSPVFGASANQIQSGFALAYAPIPEPSSMALAGLGAASLLLFRRRK
jgi:hypothetical protein